MRDGFDVISVSRHRTKPLGAERVVTIPMYDRRSIAEAAKDCSVVIHLVGGGKQTVRSQYHDANYLPAAIVAGACADADVPRMIYLSGLGVSPEAISGYFISKYIAEQAVVGSVPEPIILRPSFIIGPDDHLTTNLNRQEMSGVITIPGSGNYSMQPISIYDAVCVLEMAATKKHFAGHTLDLVGPQITTFAEYIGAFASPQTKILHVNMEQIYQDAVLDRDPIYDLDDLNIMVGGYVGDHDTLRQMTGMTFHTIPQMLESSCPA